MARSASDLAAIKAELTNDPTGLGLTSLPEDDAANAEKLNAVNPTTLIMRRWVTTPEILNEIPSGDHQGLSEQQHRYLSDVLSLGQIDPFKNSNLVCGICDLFAAESGSREALEAVMKEPGNRIDQMYQQGLLEVGGTVTPSDVAQARQLP
jgi:hypothetical protein